MSKTVKIGDSVVGQIAVGLYWFVGDVRDSLNFSRVAWHHDAHMDSQSCPVRSSVRRDQGRHRRSAGWCEALDQQWYVCNLTAPQICYSSDFQANFMAKVSQRQTWTCSPRSTRNTLNAWRRPSYPSKEVVTSQPCAQMRREFHHLACSGLWLTMFAVMRA